MKQVSDHTRWTAQWIWGGEEASPRNEWRCFRKSFKAPDECVTARLRISADSRYVLWINGMLIGRGPVRSWPKEQFYDTYDVGHLLRPGENNVIAVLVIHWGVSNFYYVRGRGGLLAELVWPDLPPMSGETPATDGTWRTTRHEGRIEGAPRMSCQQAFAEVHDAGRMDDKWTQPDFDDRCWAAAEATGPVGSEPWRTLIPRDIPFLTEEKRLPARLISLSRVKPPSWTAAIDLRAAMVPESASHANPIDYTGYLAAVLVTEEAGPLTIGFPGGARSDKVWLAGRLLEGWHGDSPERYATIELPAGEHLLLVDVSSWDHGGSFHIALDAKSAFTMRSPLGTGGKAEPPFALAGPFYYKMHIDYEEDDHAGYADHPDYLALRGAADPASLLAFRQWLRPVPSGAYTEQDVFAASVWTTERRSFAVPPPLQRALTAVPEPGIIPMFEGGYDTELIVDFGRELSGYIGFELDAEEGTVIDLYGVEYINGAYIQHTYWLDNTLRYITRRGRQRYLSPIRRGLRYLIVTIRGAVRPVALHEVWMIQSNYPVTQAGTFRCSDPLLNEIWEISRHTTMLCMEDTFVDCPAYEQVYWVGDSRNEALVNYYVFGAVDIVKRCLRLVSGSRDITPLLLDQVPSGWSSVIPNWTFFWANACKEYVEHTGDPAFAREIWPTVYSALRAYLAKLNGDGLLEMRGWNLLDWAPIDQPNEGIVTHQNMLLVQALRNASSLADRTGLDSFAREGRVLLDSASDLAEAINKHLWDDDHAAFIDCIHSDGRRSAVYSMQTQVAAFLSGAVTGERLRLLETYLLHPPESFVEIGSPFMSFFYYEALEQIGETSRMLADIRRRYGEMLRHDATTCWELYPDSDINRANRNQLTRSHCHAWSAAPGYFLGRSLLGVRRLDDGWRRVAVMPDCLAAEWASGAVPLPAGGSVEVAWERTDRHVSLNVSAPEGVIVEVRLPEGVTADIRTSSKAMIDWPT